MKYKQCRHCQGLGILTIDSIEIECYICEGLGKIAEKKDTLADYIWVKKDCEKFRVYLNLIDIEIGEFENFNHYIDWVHLGTRLINKYGFQEITLNNLRFAMNQCNGKALESDDEITLADTFPF